MDCLVALLPCANASRLSQAKTWTDFQIRISNSQERNAVAVIASEAKQSMARHRQIEGGLLRFARNDGGGRPTHTFAISLRMRASLACRFCHLKTSEGCRECRALDAPAASHAK